MDFREILLKMAEKKEKEVVTESVKTEKVVPSLKEVFESLQTKMPIPVVGKEGDKASTQAGFVHIDDTSPAGKAMSDALGKLAQQKKAQIVVPVQAQKPAQQQTGLSTGGGAMAPTVKEEQVDEKAVSKAQQKFMGMVHAAQKGKKPASKAVADVAKSMKKGDVKDFAKTKHKGLPEKKKKTNEAEIASTKSQDTMGAGLGAGRSDKVIEGAKPDFLDLDKDGNKKETMKKAAADKKKKVKESMNPKIKAAYHEGYSHGLRGASHSGKRYEDMEEARQYHEGYKMGLDECYGMSGDPKMGDRQSPILGLVGENMPASTGAMATQAMPAMEAGVGEGNAFTAALAKTKKGDTFKVDGKTYTDTSNYNSNLDEFAFESLDKALAELLVESVEEPVTEGLSVSMSTGQQGSPDSVSVTGTDDEAGKLLAFIKQVGLGGMGADAVQGEAPAVVTTVSDYGAPKGDNPDMKALLQKVGVDDEEGADYKDEHEHDHGAVCNECGMMEAKCGCEKEAVDEVQTQDQTLYATTSESDNSEDDGFDASARNTEIDNAGKPAFGGATNEDGAEAPGSNPVGQAEQEEAEEVNEESTEKMDQKAEKAAEKVKKDIEYDDKKDREHDKLDEWANNAGQKGTDTAFEQDIEFMTKVISGGLNKPKATGQTTIPVIAGQDARTGDEDVTAWKKLAGLIK